MMKIIFRAFLTACFLLGIVHSSALAALGFDAATTAGNGGSITTLSVLATTAGTNRVLIFDIGVGQITAGTLRTVVSVSDGTLSAVKHTNCSATSFGTAAGNVDFERWWVLAPSQLTSDSFTITVSASADIITAVVYGVSGANTTAPFDTNASLSNTSCAAVATTGIPSISGISTTCDKTAILFAATDYYNASAPPAQTAGTGYTMLATERDTVGANFQSTASEQQIVAAAQSGISPAFGTSWTGGWIGFADAVKDATASCGGGGAVIHNLLLLGVGK